MGFHCIPVCLFVFFLSGFLSGITINQFEYSPDVHTLTIMFNVTTGEEGIYHYNFTGLVREREL